MDNLYLKKVMQIAYLSIANRMNLISVSLVHVSASSFTVSQASDLALLVGYVGLEDFKELPIEHTFSRHYTQ